MILHVQYKDLRYDYVTARILDELLAHRQLRLFFRPSEKRWVNVLTDPVRGAGGEYAGPDRRERRKARKERRASTGGHTIRIK